MIWIEKFKSMGPSTLDSVEGGRGCAEERVIFTDVVNVSMMEGINQTL